MAMINCPECGKELSSEAKLCPHCGFPIKKATAKKNISKNLFALIASIAIVAFALIYFFVISPNSQDKQIQLPFGLKPSLSYEEALDIMSKNGFVSEQRSTAFGFHNETVFSGGVEALGQTTEKTDFVWEPEIKIVEHEFHEIAFDYSSPDSTYMTLKTELTKKYGEPSTANAPIRYEWTKDDYQIVLQANNTLFEIPYCHTVMYSFKTGAYSVK